MHLASRPRHAVARPMPALFASLILTVASIATLGLGTPVNAAGSSVLARDSFSRSTSGSLGTAEQGGTYITTASGARIRVSGGKAVLSLARPGAIVRASSPGVRAKDVLVRLRFQL